MELSSKYLLLLFTSSLAMPARDNHVPGRPTTKDVHHVPCKPREMVVSISNTVSGGEQTLLVPDLVLVKRCAGYCGNSVTCVPDNVKIVKRWVKEFNLFQEGSSRAKMQAIKVEEHLSCKCGCKIQAETCSPAQKFDPKRCRCVCDGETAKKAACAAPREWNPDTCSCECTRGNQQCSSGTKFNMAKCSGCTPKRKKKTKVVK